MIRSNSPVAVLKTSTNETIDSYPKTAIQAFTDGSAFKATVIAGFGVHLKFPDRSFQNLSEPGGNICSNLIKQLSRLCLVNIYFYLLKKKITTMPVLQYAIHTNTDLQRLYNQVINDNQLINHIISTHWKYALRMHT